MRRLLVLAAVLAALPAAASCTASAATPETIFVTLPPAAVTPTPEATPAPSPTATPEPEPTPTPTPTPSPTSPAAGCTGSAEHRAYFVNAASNLSFDVYCAVLPKTFWLDISEFNKVDGQIYVVYRNNAGDQVVLLEGRICSVLATCMDGAPVIGPASFGGLAGTLRVSGTVASVAVDPKTTHGYVLYSPNLSQAKVLQYAAAVVKVAKPAP